LTKFILVIKLFILEVPVNKAYKELYLAYKTTHKMDNRIRQCIFKFGSEDGEFLSGEVEMDESYFGGRRKVKRGRGIILGLTWMKCCPMCLVGQNEQLPK
jgi:transposase